LHVKIQVNRTWIILILRVVNTHTHLNYYSYSSDDKKTQKTLSIQNQIEIKNWHNPVINLSKLSY